MLLKKLFKTINVLLILTILSTCFAGFENISFAKTEENEVSTTNVVEENEVIANTAEENEVLSTEFNSTTNEVTENKENSEDENLLENVNSSTNNLAKENTTNEVKKDVISENTVSQNKEVKKETENKKEELVKNVKTKKITKSIALNSGSSIKITNKRKDMVIDKEYQLKVETDSSTPVEYTSSEESVAKIDDSGKITTLSEGETEITASIGEYVYDKFTLNVHTEEIHLTSIKLAQTKIEFDKTTITNSSGFIENEMTPKEIEVSIICEPANTTDDLSFTCVSQNNNMVSAEVILDENGDWKVIAKGSTYDVGETKIIVKEESNPSINCELTVYSYGINAVEYHKNLRNGDTFQTEYKTYFRDSDEIVTSKSYAVTWQDVYEDDRLPGNPVAKVDQNGLITGVDNGACTVTLTVETNKGKKYTTKFSITCHVRILGVKAIKDIIELKPKDVFTVANNLEFIPKNAEGYRIVSTIIEDNNPCVSLGDANGFFLKAEKPGTAKITVTIGVDSETYSASFEVKVLCDHISTEGHEGKDPTCTEMGYLPYQVCTECGVVIYDGKEYNSFDEIEKDRLLPINENNHINLQDYEATSSTCVTQGHLGYTKCEDCGKVEYSGKWYDSFDDIPEDELLPLTDHTGGTATCSKKAICDVCKKEYGEYDSSKHESTTVYQAVASTCLVHGHEEYEMCDECGTIISGSDALLPLADHTGGTATCSKKAICSVCNQEYGNYDNTKHTNIQSYEAIESTCETQGHSAYTKCEDCGTIISGSDALLPLASHTGGTATCTEKAICDVCGQEYGDYDSTNHTNLQNYEAISSTCITQGHSAYTKCEDCGTIISGSDTLLPLLDHTGGTATCTKKAVCDVCGQEYGDFDSTNHINTQSYSATSSTCLTHGHSAYTKCKDCGTIISGSDALLPLANHIGGGRQPVLKRQFVMYVVKNMEILITQIILIKKLEIKLIQQL